MGAALDLWGIVSRVKNVLDSLEEGEVTEHDDKLLNELHDGYIEKCASIARYLDGLHAEEEALTNHIMRLTKRRNAVRTRQSKLKEYLAACMRAAGTPKLDVGSHKLTLARPPEKVEVRSEEEIPEAFWKVTRSIDKEALRQSLKDGNTVAGAMLVRGLDYVRVK